MPPARNHRPNSAEGGLFRSEPTVFSAIRRYRIMILVIAILGLVVAGAYAAIEPKVYQAEANVTVPLPASSQVGAADVGQYVDNQVVLLTSEGIAQQAADIANSELGGQCPGYRWTSTAATASWWSIRQPRPPRAVRGQHHRGLVQGPEPSSCPGGSQRRTPSLRRSRTHAIKGAGQRHDRRYRSEPSVKAPAKPSGAPSRLNGRRHWSTSRRT